MSGLFLLLPCLISIPDQNANRVDPDQTPRYAASDLGQHCLPIPFYGTLGINGFMIYFDDIYTVMTI